MKHLTLHATLLLPLCLVSCASINIRGQREGTEAGGAARLLVVYPSADVKVRAAVERALAASLGRYSIVARPSSDLMPSGGEFSDADYLRKAREESCEAVVRISAGAYTAREHVLPNSYALTYSPTNSGGSFEGGSYRRCAFDGDIQVISTATGNRTWVGSLAAQGECGATLLESIMKRLVLTLYDARVIRVPSSRPEFPASLPSSH